MGSPFPLFSSGQSLSGGRQGYSPRDFGMVPRTPQIPDYRATWDQHVPQTPDTTITPSNRVHTAAAGPATPCNVIETTHPNAETPRTSITTSRENDSLCLYPDQQVPATPQGGFSRRVYQSPVPYFTHFNSPPSLQSSQETTGACSTQPILPFPSPHTDGPMVKTRHRLTPHRVSVSEHTRRHTSHTRQTPSLSSRRRLALGPCLEFNSHRAQPRESTHQINVDVRHETTNLSFSGEHKNINNADQHDETNHSLSRSGNMSEATKGSESCGCAVGDNASNDGDDKLPLLQRNEGNFGILPVNKSINAKVVQTIHYSGAHKKVCPTKQTGTYDSRENPPMPRLNLVNDADGDLRNTITQSKHEGDDGSIKSEIDRRVQQVLGGSNANSSSSASDNPTATSSWATQESSNGGQSVLTLFEDDDFIFG